MFQETYKAYRQGRADINPAEGWYRGEIGFFDFYSMLASDCPVPRHVTGSLVCFLLFVSVIPLCEKIRDCGVFGPTSDENLNYATNNRNMWVKEGEAIVQDMLTRVNRDLEKERDESLEYLDHVP